MPTLTTYSTVLFFCSRYSLTISEFAIPIFLKILMLSIFYLNKNESYYKDFLLEDIAC
jgi:hypothetical protein